MGTYEFHECLARSMDGRSDDEWLRFYRGVWPEMRSMRRIDAERSSTERQLQLWGVDRIIGLPDGRELTVDEKFRDENKPYRDVLLEEVHRFPDGRSKPGWAADVTKRMDFVAYYLAAFKLCYLLPFELTRLAFARHLDEWKARRGGYPRPSHTMDRSGRVIFDTYNVAVPFRVLQKAIAEEMEREDREHEGPDDAVVLWSGGRPRLHLLHQGKLFE